MLLYYINLLLGGILYMARKNRRTKRIVKTHRADDWGKQLLHNLQNEKLKKSSMKAASARK